jgi:hypothetical protein
MSAGGRFCCRSLLQAFLVSDSVAVMRFGMGANHDGAAQSRLYELVCSDRKSAVVVATLVDSVNYLMECGRALSQKKESLGHGSGCLGFSPTKAP